MRLGLLGNGISYSFSPLIFETISKKLNISLTYELFDVEKESLQEIIEQLKNQSIQGLNVTKPYKKDVMRYCDDVSEEAKIIGAVNTLVLKNGRIYGYNTDSFGFKSLLEFYQIDMFNKNICILGNGGSSKAVFHSMYEYKDNIKVVKRSTSNQESYSKNEINYEDLNSSTCDIFIQTTTVGLHEDDQLLFDYNMLKNHIVIDLIYHRKTEIMKASKMSYGGLMMLIFQALRSFEIWNQKKLTDMNHLSLELKEALENEFNRKSI